MKVHQAIPSYIKMYQDYQGIWLFRGILRCSARVYQPGYKPGWGKRATCPGADNRGGRWASCTLWCQCHQSCTLGCHRRPAARAICTIPNYCALSMYTMRMCTFLCSYTMDQSNVHCAQYPMWTFIAVHMVCTFIAVHMECTSLCLMCAVLSLHLMICAHV